MRRRGPKRDLDGRGRATFWNWTLVVLAALMAPVGACGREPVLLPASGYTSVIGRSSLAVESRSGVTVTADASVWDSSPKNLATEVTPVWITLYNATGRPLRVQYDEFTLRGASGASYIALAPYVLRPFKRTTVFEVPNGGYFDKFQVAAYLAPFYPWLPVWGGPLPYGPFIYSVAWRARLPTDSMLDRALPEGVVENEGTASGYLYFQKVGPQEREVTFQAALQEPTWAPQAIHQLAAIDIPFHRIYRRPQKQSPYTAPRSPDWMY
jgi:hypothetical protein